MATRLLDLTLMALLLACATQAAAMKIHLNDLLSHQQRGRYPHTPHRPALPHAISHAKRAGLNIVDRPDDDNSENSIGGKSSHNWYNDMSKLLQVYKFTRYEGL